MFGIYFMLPDHRCRFLAADFDEDAWRSKRVPAALERSRSGNSARIWIFFSEPVLAILAGRHRAITA